MDQLNDVFADIATEMAGLGVIYVDGLQGAYDGHRFCEPAPKDYLEKPIGARTWFWHHQSPDWRNGGEGPTGFSATGAVNASQNVLDALIPSHALQASISEDHPP